jgi:hypothetical protein
METPQRPERPKAYKYLLLLVIVVGTLAVIEVIYDYRSVVKPGTSTTHSMNTTVSTSNSSAIDSAHSALTPAGTRHFPAQGHVHDPDLVKVFDYNSNPPTSGPHDEVYPPHYVNDQPIEKAALIHMLEHGNIVIAYNALPSAELQQLTEWVNQHNHGMAEGDLQSNAEAGKLVFLSPWSGITKGTIDALAWTRLYAQDKFDAKNLDAFVEAWQHNLTNMQQ